MYDSHDYVDLERLFSATQAMTGAPYVNAPTRYVPAHWGDMAWSISIGASLISTPTSEFGGTGWNPDAREARIRGDTANAPRRSRNFHDRLEAVAIPLDDPNMFGYCYTQLTDVLQEQNGIYRYDRSVKSDMSALQCHNSDVISNKRCIDMTAT